MVEGWLTLSMPDQMIKLQIPLKLCRNLRTCVFLKCCCFESFWGWLGPCHHIFYTLFNLKVVIETCNDWAKFIGH